MEWFLVSDPRIMGENGICTGPWQGLMEQGYSVTTSMPGTTSSAAGPCPTPENKIRLWSQDKNSKSPWLQEVHFCLHLEI